LQSAAGFLQSKVAKRIDTRYTPKLQFVLDQGVKKSIEVSQILGRVLAEDRPSAPTDDPAARGEAHGSGRNEPPTDADADEEP
jgi:ribosome-binding factor A